MDGKSDRGLIGDARVGDDKTLWRGIHSKIGDGEED
jgi:hypothetical protein